MRFVSATIDKTVFVQCPEGFEIEGKNPLLRVLFGLRRLPLLWLKSYPRL